MKLYIVLSTSAVSLQSNSIFPLPKFLNIHREYSTNRLGLGHCEFSIEMSDLRDGVLVENVFYGIKMNSTIRRFGDNRNPDDQIVRCLTY